MPKRSKDPVTSLIADTALVIQQRGGRFLVLQGPDRGESVDLPENGVVTFGSSPSCSLPLSDKTVSRNHLEARWAEGGVVLRDLGSTNGTFYGGSRIQEITIGYGVDFTLGRTVIKFLPEEEPATRAAAKSHNYGSLVGKDEKMRRLFALLDDVAATDATVIIEGETGTGKELVAEEIHKHSRRRDRPFVVFDCGAVPHDLIESSLFGHMRGSFTGAVADRRGSFAEANGGTIFLDEVGELDLELQPALLRALDKRAVRRVGDTRYEAIDVRVIAATHRDLREEVARKAFREDLYYRLAVIRIHLPALRERGADIPFLAEHFVRQLSPPGKRLRITQGDLDALVHHSWPGNVRELRNAVERACALASGDALNLDSAFAEGAVAKPGMRTDLPFKEAKGQLLERFEREYVVDLMRRHKMNVSSAAREAQIDRKHLQNLLRKYQISG